MKAALLGALSIAGSFSVAASPALARTPAQVATHSSAPEASAQSPSKPRLSRGLALGLSSDVQRPLLVTASGSYAPSGGMDSISPPSTGTGYLIAGIILTAVGTVNLLTSPVCRSSGLWANDEDLQDACFYGSLIGGGVRVAVGVPLLIVGIAKRSTYKEWQQRRTVGVLRELTVAAGPRQARLVWQRAF